MSRELFFVLFCYCFASVLSESDLQVTPCRRSDSVCLNNIANALYAATIRGNPNLGIESSDPLYQKSVGGNLSIIKYSFKNTTLTGFKDCNVASTKFTPNRTVHFEIKCPLFEFFGQYDIDGKLIIWPIEGSGDFRAETRDYHIYLDAELKFSRGKNGRTYAKIKKFKSDAELMGGMDFDFENLFNGRQELAEQVLNFARFNWKAVSKLLQGPIFTSNIRGLVVNFNKYLKTLPVEDIFVD